MKNEEKSWRRRNGTNEWEKEREKSERENKKCLQGAKL